MEQVGMPMINKELVTGMKLNAKGRLSMPISVHETIKH